MKTFSTILQFLFVIFCGAFLVLSSIKTTSWDIIDFCQGYTAARRFLGKEVIYKPLNCLSVPMYASVQYDAHPPFSIFMFLPFAGLSMDTALVIWFFISVVLYYISGILLLRLTKLYSPLAVVVFTLFSVLWRPFVVANSVHNIMQFIFFLIITSFFFYKRGNYIASGLLLGVASLLKIYPAGIVVIALVCRKIKLSISAAGTFLAGVVLALLVFGVGENTLYVTRVMPNERFFYPDPGNMSIPGFVTRLFSGFIFYNLGPVVKGLELSQGALIGEIVGIVFFVLFGAVLYLKSKEGNHKFDDFIIFGITPILVHLSFPISWDWEGTIFLLPVLLLLQRLRTFSPTARAWYLFLGAGMIPVISPYWRTPFIALGIHTDNSALSTLISGWYTPLLILFLLVLINYLDLIKNGKLGRNSIQNSQPALG